MTDRFRRHLQDSGLIPTGARVLVGYSGGADSTALLHLLHIAGVEVVAAHLHHGQREEAEQELEKCRTFAEQLGIPFMAGRANVPKMAADLGLGLEEAGREARYGFFREAAFGMECQLIATAHTLTDHIETVLMNVTRGTGLSGLAGIPTQRENIVRPLLIFSREETQAYCQQHHFWTHDDPSNFDIRFTRTRIRQNVVPELKLINPGLETAVLRLSSIADEEDRFLNGMAAAALERSENPLNGELFFLTNDVEMQFDRLSVAHLPPALRKRALRLASEAMGSPLTFEQTQMIANGIVTGIPGSITCEGGEVVVEWTQNAIDVRRLLPSTPFRYSLTVPGETISDEFGWQFTAFEADADTTPAKRASLDIKLNSQAIKGSLYFRTFKTGDMMQPLGFSGRRKLSDLFSEAKLTPAARSRLPIVCDMIGPIWAPGICLDERVRPIGDSTRVIVMRFGNVRA